MTLRLRASCASASRAALIAGAVLIAPAASEAAPGVTAAAPAAPAAGAAAPGPAPTTDPNDASSVSEVVVTGLRGQKKTVIDSPSPIDVVSGAQLQATGKVGLKEILNTVVPSFNLPGVNGGGTSWTVRAYTIRGLNGDQALFLVDGKRRHTTALINNLARVGNGGVPVDVDLIPVSAIDHIEVLRDGAAAQYGSDAIAGVINIILKKGASGGQSSTTLGANFQGDGFTAHEAADAGFGLPGGGFLHLALDYKNTERATRSLRTTSTLYGPLGKPFGTDPRDLTADRFAFGHTYGPGEEEIVSSAFNLETPLNPGLTFYSFGTVTARDTRKNTGTFLPNNKNSLPDVYPDGFSALRRIYETDYQVNAGVRGDVLGWDLDLGASYARDYAYLGAQNTLNASLGPASPHDFKLSTHVYDQIVTTLDLRHDYGVGLAKPLTVAVGVEHRYERFEIRAGDPNSYVVGDYVIPSGLYAGQRPNPGLASYTGTSPSDAGSSSRNNVAAYVDLSTEVVKGWYVGAAGRFEHYTGGPGDTASGKFTTRYEFLPGYAVRASISNGFRAPSLAQDIFASSTISGLLCPSAGALRGTPCRPGDYVTLPTKFLPAGTPAAEALGAQTLRPETSVNYSAGLTAQPWRALRLSVDGYRIDIDDRILSTGAINLTGANLASNPALAALLPRFPQGFIAQYFTNAASTRTQGVDVVAEYPLTLANLGRLDLSAAYTYTDTTITKLKATPSQLAGFGFVLFDRQKQADLTRATPKDKLLFSGDWSLGRWRTSLRLTRYGEYTEVNAITDPTLDRTYSPKWITDLDVTYAFTPRTDVSIGANNIFDIYPDAIGVVDSQTGAGRYGNFGPFGITGGFYYARLTQRF